MKKSFEDLNYYELLKVPIDASSFEIRQAYKNVSAIYEEGSLSTYSLFSEDERRSILERIEKAFLTLADGEKRIVHDNELMKSGEIPDDILARRGLTRPIPQSRSNTSAAISMDSRSSRKEGHEQGQKELSGSMPVGEFISGKDLKKLRESLGIDLKELFQTTKISPTILQAIETDDKANLPPAIYLNSFLKSYAEVLQLDTKMVVDGYRKNLNYTV